MSELPERDRFLEMLKKPGEMAQDGINWLIKGVDYLTDQTNTWEEMGYSPEEIEQNKEALKYEIATGIIGGGAALKGIKALSPHVKKLMKSIQNALKSKTGSKATETIQFKSSAYFTGAPPRGIPQDKSFRGGWEAPPVRPKPATGFRPPRDFDKPRVYESKVDLKALEEAIEKITGKNKQSIDRLRKARGTGWDSMGPTQRAWMEKEASIFGEKLRELGIPMEKATRTGGSSLLKKLLPFLLLSEHK